MDYYKLYMKYKNKYLKLKQSAGNGENKVNELNEHIDQIKNDYQRLIDRKFEYDDIRGFLRKYSLGLYKYKTKYDFFKLVFYRGNMNTWTEEFIVNSSLNNFRNENINFESLQSVIIDHVSIFGILDYIKSINSEQNINKVLIFDSNNFGYRLLDYFNGSKPRYTDVYKYIVELYKSEISDPDTMCIFVIQANQNLENPQVERTGKNILIQTVCTTKDKERCYYNREVKNETDDFTVLFLFSLLYRVIPTRIVSNDNYTWIMNNTDLFPYKISYNQIIDYGGEQNSNKHKRQRRGSEGESENKEQEESNLNEYNLSFTNLF